MAGACVVCEWLVAEGGGAVIRPGGVTQGQDVQRETQRAGGGRKRLGDRERWEEKGERER